MPRRKPRPLTTLGPSATKVSTVATPATAALSLSKATNLSLKSPVVGVTSESNQNPVLLKAAQAHSATLNSNSYRTAADFRLLEKTVPEALLAVHLSTSNLVAIIISFGFEHYFPESFDVPIDFGISFSGQGEIVFESFRDVILQPSSGGPPFRGKWWASGDVQRAWTFPIEIEWDSGDRSTGVFHSDKVENHYVISSFVDNMEYSYSWKSRPPMKSRTYYCDRTRCPDYCFAPDCSIVLADGSLVKAAALRVGSVVRTGTGACDTIECCVTNTLARCVEMVEIDDGIILTPGHPIWLNCAPNQGSRWVRPSEIGVSCTINVSAVYNFVLKNRGTLLVQSRAGTQWQVSSLAHFCEGIDVSGSFFGSERAVKALQQEPSWPNVHLSGLR